MLALAATAAAAGSGWSRQHTPNPRGTHGNYLNAVSCTNTCTAVGVSQRSAVRAVTLAEHWNGKRWSIQHSANRAGEKRSDLEGVSCPFAKTCIAVGYSGNGGTRRNALAERFNGKRWSIMQVRPQAPVSSLASVSCTSPHSCTAVGFTAGKGGKEVPLAEHWNGKGWSTKHPRPPKGATDSSLAGVWCTWPTACTAVGSYRTGGGLRPLAERWNGSEWVRQHPPAPSGEKSSFLLSVSCPASGVCTAVGAARNGSGSYAALAERGGPNKWTLQHLTSPSGARGGYLAGVSCTSKTECTAVGYYVNGSSAQVTLSERWNGKRWFVQPTPKPGHSVGSYLDGVSCASSSQCTAAGYYLGGGQTPFTLAERWRN